MLSGVTHLLLIVLQASPKSPDWGLGKGPLWHLQVECHPTLLHPQIRHTRIWHLKIGTC